MPTKRPAGYSGSKKTSPYAKGVKKKANKKRPPKTGGYPR